MDNCLLNDTKFIPNWYIKVLSYFPEYRTYNNFFNNKEFGLYKMIKPRYGIYSLKNVYDLLKIHPTLNKQDIIVLKHDSEILTLFEYTPETQKFLVQKIIKNELSVDYDFINLVDAIISNDPKIILHEELFIGILYALKIKHLMIPELRSKLDGIKYDECLKFYKTSKNYNFIYNALYDLLHTHGATESEKLKRNEYKINFNVPNNILISNLSGGLTLDNFKNGTTTASKKDIIYHTIILCIIIGRFCKQTGLRKKILDIEYVIDQYLTTLNVSLRNDILIMIKLLEHDRILYKRNEKFYIIPNYEQSIYTFFVNSSYWWSLNPELNIYYKVTYEGMNNLANEIFKKFKSLKKNNFVNISCHSGCDNTFIEKCTKLQNSLLFIETLPQLFSSNENSNIAINTKGLPYNNVSINFGMEINLYTLDGSVYVDINDNKKLILTPIFSKETIIDKYDGDNVLVMEYNLLKIRYSMIDLMKLDIAQYLFFIKDALKNDNVIYSSDPNMRLLSHLFGTNLIYERITKGSRYLEIYNKSSSNYSL